jgi:hypothetical protein
MTTTKEEARAAYLAENKRQQEAGQYVHPVLLPQVTDFGEVLEYLGEWTPERIAAARTIGDNVIGPYTTISTPSRRHRGVACRASDAVIEAVEGRIVTPDDRLSFRVIEHAGSGCALVILEHGYIIGSHYLAYIYADTIPPVPRPRFVVPVVIEADDEDDAWAVFGEKLGNPTAKGAPELHYVGNPRPVPIAEEYATERVLMFADGAPIEPQEVG